MSKNQEPEVTLQGEAPVAPEPIAPTKEMKAAAEQDAKLSAFYDANIADKALKANATQFPSLEEPNMPHDKEVLQNYTYPPVVTRDDGFGMIEGVDEKDPSATVQDIPELPKA